MFPLRRPRFFYGWTMMVISFSTGGFTAGLAIWAPSVFVGPMREELGWSLTDFFLAFTIRSVVAGLIVPITGPLLDKRNGARALGTAGVLLMGISLAGTGFIGRIGLLEAVDLRLQFYFFFGVIGAAAFTGSGFVIANAVLPKWFIRKRGRAMGIASMGSGLGPMIFPLLALLLIESWGWRDAWVALGATCVAFQLPLMLLVRTQPEDMGLLPDGAATEPKMVQDNAAGAVFEQSFTRQQVLRMPVFWVVVAAVMLASTGFQGFQPNWVPYIQSEGFSDEIAVTSVMLYGFFSGTTRGLWGLLAERFPVRNLMVVQMALTSASILILIFATNQSMIMGYMVIAGMTMGGFFILQPILVASYFGRGHLGAVSTAIMPFNTMAGAVAPVLVSVLYDSRGDYFLAFFLALAAWAAAAMVIFASHRPRTVGLASGTPAR